MADLIGQGGHGVRHDVATLDAVLRLAPTVIVATSLAGIASMA